MGGGGYSETEKSESAKMCLNFNFWGGGVFWNWKVRKCQDVPKFQFSGGGGYSETEKSQSAKICLNFNFRGGGVFRSKLMVWKIWTKIYCSARNLLVHHSSLSHMWRLMMIQGLKLPVVKTEKRWETSSYQKRQQQGEFSSIFWCCSFKSEITDPRLCSCNFNNNKSHCIVQGHH